MIIDLRSDTVTKPCNNMLEAMMEAKVGDDVYKEDETVNTLEQRVANMFGMDKGLFFPTGTMANQTAIKLHTNPGEQVICHKYAHIYNYEGGGLSFNSGVSCKLLNGEKGMFTANQVEAAINPPDFYHSPLTSLVAIENTTNKGGGSCWNETEMLKIKTVCKNNNLKYHIDGARLWNALVATKQEPKFYGTTFDTISLCFSKGLGCPIGSILLMNNDDFDKAMRIRKILGAGMRQVGYLAAAALYAIEYNIERLNEDHKKANELAKVLNNQNYINKVEPVETNILIFYLNSNINETLFINTVKEKGVILSSMGEGKLRLVTHKDYTTNQHEKVIEILTQIAF